MIFLSGVKHIFVTKVSDVLSQDLILLLLLDQTLQVGSKLTYCSNHFFPLFYSAVSCRVVLSKPSSRLFFSLASRAIEVNKI